jgi:hypothetical protein
MIQKFLQWFKERRECKNLQEEAFYKLWERMADGQVCNCDMGHYATPWVHKDGCPHWEIGQVAKRLSRNL